MQQDRRACFELKACSRRFVFDKLRMQNLDRDRTVHRQVTRTIDSAHAAFAERFFEVVLFVEGSTDKWIRGDRLLAVCQFT